MTTKYTSDEISRIFIEIDALLLRMIPKRLITSELCEIAVKQKGNALQFVPIEHKTKDVCEIAVSNCPSAIKYVQEDILTDEMGMLAYEILGPSGVPAHMLEKVKCKIEENKCKNEEEKYGTEAKCLELIEADWDIIACIPTRFLTNNICELARNLSGGFTDQYIPDEFKPSS